MIADVVFDVPVPHPFSYTIPASWSAAPGQRVRAPLHGSPRVGLVVAVREGTEAGLKPLAALVDRGPVLSGAQLDLARWIAAQSLSTLGSTCAALLPPAGNVQDAGANTATVGPASERPHLLVGHGRERRLLEQIGATNGPSLVLVPDLDAATRWATRLARLGPVVRLDSGAEDEERAAAWRALAEGQARLAVGTRSALLASLSAGGLLALIDEHEAAHKPPGPPRMHTRDVVLERARREPLAVVLTSATPSVETWWRADARRVERSTAPPAAWPAVTVADTRGILRREPITPPLARAMREALAAGHRVFLGVSRLTAALACDECGGIVRCEQCGLALTYARAAATLTCRLCAAARPLPDLCPACRGRRLSPFGWSPERVEHAVRRRFPKASVARYDPDARGARAETQRHAAAHAEVVVGTRSALKLFGPASLGAAGFVTPDQLFRLPDFRAGERAFSLLWAAAERVRPDGALVVQSQNPAHYAIASIVAQDLDTFYKEELKFRAELGYPPFRRLAIVTISGKSATEVDPLTDAAATALRGASALTVYPAATDRGGRARRIVVKGGDDLPDLLEAALAEFRRPRPRSRGIMDVEVDPVEWPS
jgi:primosomal protein N' (replication factor Y) (superfamily II helicase)